VSSVFSMWQVGGGWMYPLALLNCGLLPLSVVLLTLGIGSKERNAVLYAVILLVAGLSPAMLGAVAQHLTMMNVEEVIAMANPADQATIRAAATGEAMTTTLFGLSGAVIPVFCGFVLLGIGLGRLPRFEESPP